MNNYGPLTMVGTGLTGSVKALAYGATITPTAALDGIFDIAQLTGSLTIAAPSGTPVNGGTLLLRFTDPNGNAVTWNAIYAFGTDIASTDVPTTAAKGFEILFRYHSGSSKWRAVALVRGF